MSSFGQQFFQRHGLAMLIGTLVMGLLGVIGVETQWGSNMRPAAVLVVGQAAKGGETSLLPAFALPPIDTGFKETVDRPLFVPSRRPVPVVSGVAPPVMKKGQFRLAGTIMNRELPYAFLVEIATGKGARVAKGAEILSTGISVSEVGAARVVLKQGEETEELSLRTASSPPVPTPLPGVPGVGPTGVPQVPPPVGVVVSVIPTANAVSPVPRGGQPTNVVPPPSAPTVLQPGASALPGFVQGPRTAAPGATPENPIDSDVGSPRRRRAPNVPQQ